MRCVKRDGNSERGVFYIAHGRKALGEALISLNSLRESNPDIGATVCTDLVDEAGQFDGIQAYTPAELWEIDYHFVTANRHGSIKGRFIGASPYLETLYLDCDTFIRGDLSPLFSMLADVDLVLTNGAVWEWGTGDVKLRTTALTDPTYFNSGVFAFRNVPAIQTLFANWWQAWVDRTAGESRFKPSNSDQTVLNILLRSRALEQHGVTMAVADNKIWNCVGSMWPQVASAGLWSQVVILHSHICSQSNSLHVDELPGLPELARFR